jgi:peptidoglycan/LPS O-acetylase OafA/YrhL
MKHKTFGSVSFVAGSLLTWYMFTMSGILCEHVLDDDYWSRTANAIWLPLRHILYSYGLTFALLPIMIGRFSWIYKVMAAKVFTPLGKISFTCFLVQFGTLFWVFGQERGPDFLNGKTVFKDITVGILLTLLFSLPVHLLVEVPFANLEKIVCSLLVKPRRPNPS